MPIELNILGGSSRTAIARIGRFRIFWQSRTKLYETPEKEWSEAKAAEILAGFGMMSDADRPDLVIVDDERTEVVSVIEVKYFSVPGDAAWDRLRDATHQIVRYARGYFPIATISTVIGNSVIALLNRPPLPDNSKVTLPFVVDMQSLQNDGLCVWAKTIAQR